MGTKKLKNLLLLLVVILVLISIPYLIYTLGTYIEIDYFGYINNWWIVLLFIVVLISVFILWGIDLDKNMAAFFLILFITSFFLLGIRIGIKPTIDMESYAILMEKEKEIDRLDSILVVINNDYTQLEDERMEELTSQSPDFRNHELIFFKAGSAELSDYNKDKITAFVSTLDGCILNVYGYSDDSGNKSSKMDISTERAQQVADFITSISQNNNTINKVTGFGGEYELVANRNEISRSKNRRVTIEVVGKNDEAEKARLKNMRSEMDKKRTDIQRIKLERDSLRKIIYQTGE